MTPPQAMVPPREDNINAFAAGWDETGAIVAVAQGVLRKVAGERARAARHPGSVARHLLPAVHHMLLVSVAT